MFFLAGILACENPNLLKIVLYIKTILEVLAIVIPIGLIVMLTIDVFRSVVGNEDTMKKTLSRSLKRIISAVIIFLVPVIINIVVHLIDTTLTTLNVKENMTSCWTNANTSDIAKFQIVYDKNRCAEREGTWNETNNTCDVSTNVDPNNNNNTLSCNRYASSDGRAYCKYNQSDSKWGSLPAGSGTIDERGCLITAMASIITGFGRNVSPGDLSYTTSGIDISSTFSRYGLTARHTTDREEVLTWLAAGNPVMIHNAEQHYRALVDIIVDTKDGPNSDDTQVYLSSVYNYDGVVDDNYGWYKVGYIFNRLGVFSEGFLISRK